MRFKDIHISHSACRKPWDWLNFDTSFCTWFKVQFILMPCFSCVILLIRWFYYDYKVSTFIQRTKRIWQFGSVVNKVCTMCCCFAIWLQKIYILEKRKDDLFFTSIKTGLFSVMRYYEPINCFIERMIRLMIRKEIRHKDFLMWNNFDFT